MKQGLVNFQKKIELTRPHRVIIYKAEIKSNIKNKRNDLQCQYIHRYKQLRPFRDPLKERWE